MDSGLLSLKWNNHSSTFFHVLETIRKQELYCDVTLACDGQFFAVHKLVLSTCSEYFRQVFERTQCKHPVIVLKDIRHKDLEALLNYMYIGEVNVIQAELSSLIKAAECLRVKGLAVPDEPPASSRKSAKRAFNDEAASITKRNRRERSNSDAEMSPKLNSGALEASRNSNYETQQRLAPESAASKDEESCEPIIVKSETVEVEETEASPTTFSGAPGAPVASGAERPSSISKFEYDDSTSASGGAGETGGGSVDAFSPSQGIHSVDHNADPMDQLPSTSAYRESSSGGWPEVMDDRGGASDGGGEGADFDPLSSMPNFSSASFDGSKSSMGAIALAALPRLMLSSHSSVSGLAAAAAAVAASKGASFESSVLTQRLMRKEGGAWHCAFPYCAYQSHSRVNLLNHVRKHTGEKPFSCDKCDYRSNQCSNLYTHLKRRHKET